MGLDGLLIGALDGLVCPLLLGAAELPPTFVDGLEFDPPIPPDIMLLPLPNLEEESLFWKPLLDVTCALVCYWLVETIFIGPFLNEFIMFLAGCGLLCWDDDYISISC